MKALLKVPVLLAALLVGSVALACGSGDGDQGPVIEIDAQQIRFSPDVVEVPAGRAVTIKLKNLDEMDHDLEVRGLQASMMDGGGHGGHGGPMAMTENVSVHAAPGKTATVTFTADQKGTYEIYCTQPGHEQLGMVGKLVVV